VEHACVGHPRQKTNVFLVLSGVGVIRDAASTEDAPQQTRPWLAMPTLVACIAACLALVMAVGLQAPAVSVGLRWTPGPRSRTMELIPIEPLESLEFARDGQPDNNWFYWVTWALAALVALAILVLVVRWILRLTRRAPARNVARTGADSSRPGEVDAQILQSGLVAAINILTSERDPGNAVVQAWQSLQDAAASAGLNRRPAETASEFTARILYRSRGSAAPIAVLLSLYHRVRFGEHSPNADDLVAAQDSLALLVDLWRADFPERRPTKAAR